MKRQKAHTRHFTSVIGIVALATIWLGSFACPISAAQQQSEEKGQRRDLLRPAFVYQGQLKDGEAPDALKNKNTLTLSNLPSIDLSVTLRDVQGGVVSPSGELLYLSAGHAEYTHPTHGINVFDLSTGQRIKQSTNGPSLFEYTFNTPTLSMWIGTTTVLGPAPLAIHSARWWRLMLSPGMAPESASRPRHTWRH